MNTLKYHLEQLYKECEHGDDNHRQWLKDKFDNYLNRASNPDKIHDEAMELMQKLLPPLEYGEDDDCDLLEQYIGELRDLAKAKQLND